MQGESINTTNNLKIHMLIPARTQILCEVLFTLEAIEVDMPDGTKQIREVEQPNDIMRIVSCGKDVDLGQYTHVIAKTITLDLCKVMGKVYAFVEYEHVLAFVDAEEDVQTTTDVL